MCCSSAISPTASTSRAVRDAVVGLDAVAHADVEAMQQHLTRIGLYKDKIDGKAGMLTRAALGAYQKSAGLKLDCWPSEAVLQSISAARVALTRLAGFANEKTRPQSAGF